MKQRITIEEYNIKWESEFNKLQTLINDVMEDSILSIEHVGSTSVKGLASKPILDIDVVIEEYEIFHEVVKLEKIGYYHQLEWSFKGRGIWKKGYVRSMERGKYSLDGTSFICV